jgi:integrase
MRRQDRDKQQRTLQTQLVNAQAEITRIQAELEFIRQGPNRRHHGVLDGRLTPVKVKEIVKQTKAAGKKSHDVVDCRNLVLQIRAGGRADYMQGYILSWTFRWSETLATGTYKTATIGLGAYRDVTIQEAREKALIHRRVLDDGGNPRIALANALCDAQSAKDHFRTFNQVLLEYVEAKLPVKSPTNPSGYTLGYKQRIEQLISDNVASKKHPTLGMVGNLPIQKVDFHLLFDVPSKEGEQNQRWGCDLTTLYRIKYPSIRDMLLHLRLMFAYAKAHGFYIGDNPVDKETVKAALPAPRTFYSKKQHQGVSYEELPAFIARLHNFRYNREWHRVGPDGRPIPAYVVEVLARTGIRVAEVTKAQWKEIDYSTMTWHVPVEHLKTKDRKGKPRECGRPIPITPRLYRIFKDMEKIRENPADQEALIFPSVSTRKNNSRSRIGHQTLIRMLRVNLNIELVSNEETEKAKAELLRQCAEIDTRTDLTRNDKICAKHAAGMTPIALAAEYGIARTYVHRIIGPPSEDRREATKLEERVNHAFRTTLLNWLRAKTSFREVLWRAQVDHELGDTQADNRYGDDLLLEQRRIMMLQYENYIDNPPPVEHGGANVIPLVNKRTA